MIPPHYFPLREPDYQLSIGASPIPPYLNIFEPDAWREEELALKRECLAFDEHYYCQALPGTEAAQQDVCHMLSVNSLLEAGNSVQEDLLILDPHLPGLPLVAGHLCFANAWCLGDKLGQPFLAIHGTVPSFGRTIGPSSQLLLERLKPGRPVQRLNWAVKSTGQLDLTSRWDAHVAAANMLVNSANAGERCWMRAERQTLSRLEPSGCILFTVHTYTQPVATLTPVQRLHLYGVLRTCPEDMLRYKGIWPFHGALLEWLSGHI
jgi:hypothetical protein